MPFSRSARLVALVGLACAASASAQPYAPSEPAASTADPPLHLEVARTYYEVNGVSAEALAADLGRRGPKVDGEHFFGLTEWEVETSFRWRKEEYGCRLGDVTVRAAVQTHLPRWRPGAAPPDSLRHAWVHFLAALDWHEHGHRALAEHAAAAIHTRLVALRARTCRYLEAKAYREVVVAIDEYEGYNKAYDEGTDHGRRQGAVWPPFRSAAGPSERVQ